MWLCLWSSAWIWIDLVMNVFHVICFVHNFVKVYCKLYSVLFCQQFANNNIQSLFPVRMQPVQHSRIRFTPAYHSLVSKVWSSSCFIVYGPGQVLCVIIAASFHTRSDTNDLAGWENRFTASFNNGPLP